MSRLQFTIVTSLSVFVALCILLQIFLVRAAAKDENRLRITGAALQEGQVDYNRLQQVANWTAELAEKQNDQALRDVLERNNIRVKSTPQAAPATTPGSEIPGPAATK